MNRNLNGSQFVKFSMAGLAESQENAEKRAFTSKTFNLEHEALEPRTREEWGHTGAKCRTCHPSLGLPPEGVY